MANHQIYPRQFFKDKAREKGLDIPKTPSRSQMIADKDTKNRFNNSNQPTQLGNVKSLDGLTLTLINPGVAVGTGFNLYKGGLGLVRKIINKGKKLALNFGDDIAAGAASYISSTGKK